jgi:hypothetical protein
VLKIDFPDMPALHRLSISVSKDNVIRRIVLSKYPALRSLYFDGKVHLDISDCRSSGSFWPQLNKIAVSHLAGIKELLPHQKYLDRLSVKCDWPKSEDEPSTILDDDVLMTIDEFCSVYPVKAIWNSRTGKYSLLGENGFELLLIYNSLFEPI